MSEYSLIQQQLDPNVEGKISRDQYLRVMKHYFMTRSRPANPHEPIPTKHVSSTPRSSFSDQPRYTKHSEMSEPEVISEMEQIDEPHRANNAPSHGLDTAFDDTVAVQSTAEEVKPTREWQNEFHRLLTASESDDEDPVPRGLEIAAFMAAFQRAAEYAMEAIISEIALDDDARSIPSLSLDDDQFLATDYNATHDKLRLGVTKFVVDGLLVYITHDEVAHKAFGHQLRAARALHDAIMATDATLLQLPLQCVVDYLGFRGLILALSPDPQNTRVLSSRMLLSCDRTSQMLLHKQLEGVWKHLGMFVEKVEQDRDSSHDRLPPFMGTAVGVSTSVSSGRVLCYLHNVFDIFPAATVSSRSAPLRPEIVSQLGETLPLDPQSYVSSLNEGPRAILEHAIITADEHVRSVVVPTLVGTVEAQSAQLCDSFTLTAILHGEGINARCLGLCFEAARSKHVKQLFLSEMVARACKKELCSSLQYVLRDATGDIKRVVADTQQQNAEDGEGSGEIANSDLQALSREIVSENALCVIHEVFNLVLGQGSSDASVFWRERLVPRMQDLFVFSSREASDYVLGGLPCDELVHWPQVLQAIQYHANVSIANQGDVHFSSSLPFPDSDGFCINPQSRLLCETTFECKSFLARTDELVSSGRVNDALEAVKTQIAILDAFPRGDASPALGRLLVWAVDLSLLLTQAEQAERFASLALEANANKPVAQAHAMLMTMRVKLLQSKPLGELQTLFVAGVETVNYGFGGVHPLLFDFYATMIQASSRHHDREGVDRLFHELAGLVKDCCGKSSVAYANVRRNQGHALVESKQIEEAASVLDDAFSVYNRLAQEQALEPISAQDLQTQGAGCLYLIAMLQAAQASPNGLEIAFSTAVRALRSRETVLPADHADVVSSLLQLGELCVALGDHYRAEEYYQRARFRLKALPATEESLAQLRKVSQAVLDAHLRSLPAEKLAIAEKIKTCFAHVVDAMEAALTAIPSSEAPRELELIRHVTHALLEQDPVEYLDNLIVNASDELQAQRRERFASGTIRRDSAAEDPAASARASPAVATSRFASFAIGQPQQTLTSPLSDPTSSSLLTRAGGFSHGAQLAALLFLVSLPDDE